VRKSRVKLTRKASSRKFSSGAKVSKMNQPKTSMRGGIRL
jgi:hypothetical protein